MKTPILSIFKEQDQPLDYLTLAVILQQIRRGKYRRIVQEVRTRKHWKEEEKVTEVLGLLPVFSPAGKFRDKLVMEDLEIPSHLMLVEIPMKPKHIPKAKINIAKAPYTYASFTRADGAGLAILVKTPTLKGLHELAFDLIRRHYTFRLNQPSETIGYSLTDTYPFSHDPEAYINHRASFFPIKPAFLARPLVNVK